MYVNLNAYPDVDLVINSVFDLLIDFVYYFVYFFF